MDLIFAKQGAGSQPRVLVIESNRAYLGLMARRLSESGFRVATADSAQAGLAEIYRMPVDLVLADANLPGTTGIELARMIRDDPAHSDLPVLVVVGRSDQSAAVRAFEAGADAVVRKPCHFEVLAACIERQLKRADSMKRLESDKATLDAKIVSRVIELRETQARLDRAEQERRRLAAIVEGKAA